MSITIKEVKEVFEKTNRKTVHEIIAYTKDYFDLDVLFKDYFHDYFFATEEVSVDLSANDTDEIELKVLAKIILTNIGKSLAKEENRFRYVMKWLSTHNKIPHCLFDAYGNYYMTTTQLGLILCMVHDDMIKDAEKEMSYRDKLNELSELNRLFDKLIDDMMKKERSKK